MVALKVRTDGSEAPGIIIDVKISIFKITLVLRNTENDGIS
mgnify:FL=1